MQRRYPSLLRRRGTSQAGEALRGEEGGDAVLDVELFQDAADVVADGALSVFGGFSFADGDGHGCRFYPGRFASLRPR